MELLQLRYFQTVARLESISKAAAYYSIPQPSMSQTITRLEKELGGVKLFDRKSGRIFLNEQGRVFLSYVEKVLGNLDEGMMAVSRRETELAGSIRIKVMENHRLILAQIPLFARLHPKVKMMISQGYYEDEDVSYDLCVSSMPRYPHLTGRLPLVKERIVLAVHKDHPLARKERVRTEDLKDQPLISMPPHSALHSLLMERCRRAGFEPHIPIFCDDPYFVRKYISENMGVALAPEVSWQGRFRPNTRLVPMEGDDYITTSYLYWREGSFPAPAVLRFKDYILEAASLLEGNLLTEQEKAGAERHS